MVFYSRSKALFDFSYERDKITLLQSAILLSCWGGQPNDYWNTFSWINTAVNIAETLSMHRSIASLNISDNDKSWWKRICWCLCTRDSFCAALLGKPLRINASQCDVDVLDLRDFASDSDPGGEMCGGPRRSEQSMYVIELCKLGMILRTIVQSRATNQTIDNQFVIDMHRLMDAWREKVPDALNMDKCDPGSPAYLYASALWLIYNHHLIYIHQMSLPESEISVSVAQEAATQITDLGCTLVASSITDIFLKTRLPVFSWP